MSALVAHARARTACGIAALENFSPNFWSDILLDGPRKHAQMEGLKRLVRDAGRAGIPVIGYNFSIAGVWGWQRKRVARGGATTAVFAIDEIDAAEPDARTAWSGTCAIATRRPDAAPVSVSEAELWAAARHGSSNELVPVAEEAGVQARRASRRSAGRTAARHAPGSSTRTRNTTGCSPIVHSPANALEFCIGSLQEMPGGDIYETTRRFARAGAIAYVHFRNVRGKVPHYTETFVDDGDVDMAEIVRVLRDEGFDGVLVPDHVPELDCPAPWHAGHAYTVGYMRALVAERRGARPVLVGGAAAPRTEQGRRCSLAVKRSGIAGRNRGTIEPQTGRTKDEPTEARKPACADRDDADSRGTAVVSAGEVVWWTPNWGEARAKELADEVRGGQSRHHHQDGDHRPPTACRSAC